MSYRIPFLLFLALHCLLSVHAAYGSGGCTTAECHAGIADIRQEDHKMMRTIKMNGSLHGDPDGCVICHGGSPAATTKTKAHTGIPQSLRFAPGPKQFYPDPGSIWIADNSCGVCHRGYVYRTNRGLMNTEAGKIQGNLTTWGFSETNNYNVPYGNYKIEDLDTLTPLAGTPSYKEYMEQQITMYPDQYPQELEKLPQATMTEINTAPKRAALTYQRRECQRCHIGVRGSQRRGDYRGMGCSACHIMYSTDGFYRGKDKTIPHDEPGHMLTHEIRGSRKTGGIPVDTCNTCHNRGKRIGVSYQGLMESPYDSPFDENGEGQPELHGKHYLFIGDDLHHQRESRKNNPQGGLLCQDCHTSIDVHGDGNIHGTTLAQVEIECADCHGSVDKYPWQLSLGYGDEFGKKTADAPRGVATEQLLSVGQFSFPYDAEDGLLLTARGNPIGNVVRRGDKVILHSATGKDFEVPVLKQLQITKQWKNESASVAMSAITRHLDTLECYSCHSSWAPQCYGCHVQVDYSPIDGKPVMGTDWVASGNSRMENGQTAESTPGSIGIQSPGKIKESRSYLRWEQPILGFNGEGRVSPLIPGCQVVYTIKNDAGKTLVHNKIALNPVEGKQLGQNPPPLALDMAPVQPHTAQRKARTCESCHSTPKSLGLGVGDGSFATLHYTSQTINIQEEGTGNINPEKLSIQLPTLPLLTLDWSQIVDREGKQLTTVGTHWPLSRAFNKVELEGLLRTGTCIGCHQNMADTDTWQKIDTTPVIDNKTHTESMNRILNYMADQEIKPAQPRQK